MSDLETDRKLSEAYGGPYVSPCLACPTPHRCTDVDRCATPKAGETWHILRAGATTCDTVKIAEMTPRTVLFTPPLGDQHGERLPLWQGLQFVERVSGPNVAGKRGSAVLRADSA